MGSAGQVLATLIRPGWESAELVIPILHKCLAALLAVLVYVAQWSPPALRIHLYIMILLTFCLWGCITWFVYEYRKMRKEGEQVVAEGDDRPSQEDDDKQPEKEQQRKPLLQQPAAPVEPQYTD